MKLFYLQMLLFFIAPVTCFADPIDKIAELIRQGNIHELSKLFASSVDITIQEEENVYSQAQAELVLNKFFDQNKLKTVNILHKVNSNQNYRFGVLLLSTTKGTFRMTVTLKESGGNLTIIEMRIETDKVK
jgi:Tfp pilus assembly ATPase PilU